MDSSLWLFPLLFIIHDMEEIVGMRFFWEKNGILLKEKYPRIATALFKDFSTECFALAVYEELLVCTFLTFLAVLRPIAIFKGLWIGALLGFDLHLIVHLGQFALLRKYIPAVVTSVLCLVPSSLLLWRSVDLSGSFRSSYIPYILMGLILVAGNLWLARRLASLVISRISGRCS